MEHREVTSSGLLANDNPIHHALLLFIVQVCVIVFVTRLLSILLRPFRQPRVVAEIIGGILLGPTGFGNIPRFTETIFPADSIVLLETFANMGLMFFVFLVGLELDIKSLRKTGATALWIAAAGICLPFALGGFVSFISYKTMDNLDKHFGPFFVFIGVALSITAFPVLARILAERKLLTTEIGQLAMSAAAVNDIVAWILLALAISLTNAGSNPLNPIWVLLLGVSFVVFMFVIVRPAVTVLARHDPVREWVVAITLLMVLAAGFTTDAIGVHVIFGGFMLGFIMPKEGAFAGVICQKVEDYVSILLLPLYFASSGLKTKLSAINNAKTVGVLVLVIIIACFGKVLTTMIVAKMNGLKMRTSLTLGFLMSTKGLIELIILNIGLNRKVINEELFAIMVIMALFTTFITTPMVIYLYKPIQDFKQYPRRKLDMKDEKDSICMLICAQGPHQLPAIIDITLMMKGQKKKSLKVCLLHLMEISDSISAIRLMTLASKDKKPIWNQDHNVESMGVILQSYLRANKLNIKTKVAISEVNDMSDDICSSAAEMHANLILLPIQKYHHHEGLLDHIYSGFSQVVTKVLRNAPCSVAMLIDKGFGESLGSPVTRASQLHVLLLFYGGPDDREALVLARRIAENSSVKLTVAQCLLKHESLSGPCHTSEGRGNDLGKEDYKATFWSLTFYNSLWLLYKNIWLSLKKQIIVLKDCWIQASKRKENIQFSQQVSRSEAQASSGPLDAFKEEQLDLQALMALEKSIQNGNYDHRVQLEVVQMDNFVVSTLNVASSIDPHGIVIVGRHFNPMSAIQKSELFTSEPSSVHSLGPVGSILVGKDSQMPASVMVVQQYNPCGSAELMQDQGISQQLIAPAVDIEMAAEASAEQHIIDATVENIDKSDNSSDEESIGDEEDEETKSGSRSRTTGSSSGHEIVHA
ncbi:hypothetical protein O6H91_15G043100 [Diphasiastrum complanatum]|uniref:Uncharacterized protein n=1 Tax=Diphasiastrum complanatum TaxID=34168 RepID=A0ACC2BHN4_DIPCM|nr:hypothetical protein O6H91_15G043100 [Diphasiastrum complanatum]